MVLPGIAIQSDVVMSTPPTHPPSFLPPPLSSPPSSKPYITDAGSPPRPHAQPTIALITSCTRPLMGSTRHRGNPPPFWLSTRPHASSRIVTADPKWSTHNTALCPTACCVRASQQQNKNPILTKTIFYNLGVFYSTLLLILLFSSGVWALCRGVASHISFFVFISSERSTQCFFCICFILVTPPSHSLIQSLWSSFPHTTRSLSNTHKHTHRHTSQVCVSVHQ